MMALSARTKNQKELLLMKNPRNNPPLIEKAKEIGKKGPLILVMTSKTRGRKSLRGETRKSQAEKNE